MIVSLDAHRRAEVLMSKAEQKASQGAVDESRTLYLQAAQQEAQAYGFIPEDRPRTRGIVAVSAVALFRKAGAHDEAVRHAHRYLGDAALPEFAHAELAAMLADSEHEQHTPALG